MNQNHYELVLEKYHERRREMCKGAVEEIKAYIFDEASRNGKAEIRICTRNYKANLPDIVAELRKDMYDPRIEEEFMVILLDKSWSEVVPEVKLMRLDMDLVPIAIEWATIVFIIGAVTAPIALVINKVSEGSIPIAPLIVLIMLCMFISFIYLMRLTIAQCHYLKIRSKYE